MALSNEQIAKTVLEAVGGKNNVTFVTHCMTRLRFNLKDMAIPDQEAMKELKGVLGVVVSGGQFQVDGLTGTGMKWLESGEVSKAPVVVKVEDGVYVTQ